MAAPENHRLDSWKEIADYLRRDISTVIRWERERGLPVHRVPGGKRHAVFAFPREIDTWISNGDEGSGPATHAPDHSQAAVGTPPLQTAVETPTSRGGLPALETGVTPAGGLPAPRDATVGTPPLQQGAKRRGLLSGLAIGAGALVLASVIFLLTRPRPEIKVLGYVQLTNDGRPKGGGLATDGARLYFVEDTPSGRMVCEVPTAGGEAVPMRTGLHRPAILGINPARTELLLADDSGLGSNPLFRFPLTGGEPQRVGNLEVSSAAWSLDGHKIFYTSGHDIGLYGVNSGESRHITTVAGKAGQVFLSLNDNALRVGIGGPGTEEASLWEVNADGSNLHPLLAGWNGARAVGGQGWTKDGKYFLMIDRPQPGQENLWVLPSKRGFLGFGHSMPLPVLSGPMYLTEAAPSWDGTQIFYTATIHRSRLVRYDTPSREFRPILPGISAEYVTFSRDGQWAAYMADPKGTLWKSRADGSGRVQLTLARMRTELPRWSPDGHWIAFMGQTPGEPWRVYLVSSDGGERRILVKSQQGQGAPTWSPDGHRIMFGDLVLGETPLKGPPTIHVYDLETQLLSTLPGSEGLWTARWSPDGNHVAALTSDSKNLMVFDFRDQKWTKLASFDQVSDMGWSQKGDRIYVYFRDAQGRWWVGQVPLADGKLEALKGLDGQQASNSLGIAPDDSVVIARDTSPTEIFALNWEAP